MFITVDLSQQIIPTTIEIGANPKILGFIGYVVGPRCFEWTKIKAIDTLELPLPFDMTLAYGNCTAHVAQHYVACKLVDKLGGQTCGNKLGWGSQFTVH